MGETPRHEGSADAQDHHALTFRRGELRWTVPAVNGAVAWGLFVDGEYQGHEIDRLLAWLSDHGYLGEDKTAIIEAGANIGTSTVPFAHATGKRVLAVEPIPDNFEILRRNVSLNGLDDRITCVRAAISAAAGEVDIVTRESGGMGEVKAEGTRQGYGERGEDSGLVRVPAITLDELVQVHKVAPEDVAFVWSDTQGYERQMIESGASLWAAGVPVFVELWRNGLQVHGGVDAFVATASRHFSSLVPRADLTKRGAAATLRPISELEGLIEATGDGHTDALLVPHSE